MARAFISRNGVIYECFETANGIGFVRVENPDEEQKDDAILALWGVEGYRVEERNGPED